jgi:hypothetical protein
MTSLTGGGKLWFRQMAGYGSEIWKIMLPPQALDRKNQIPQTVKYKSL